MSLPKDNAQEDDASAGGERHDPTKQRPERKKIKSLVSRLRELSKEYPTDRDAQRSGEPDPEQDK